MSQGFRCVFSETLLYPCVPSLKFLVKHYILPKFENGVNNSFSGKDLLSTDVQHSDDFALLAAHLLLDCCERSSMKIYVPPISKLKNEHCTLFCINSSLGKKILFAQGWICPGMDLLWGAGVHPPLALALARGVQWGC